LEEINNDEKQYKIKQIKNYFCEEKKNGVLGPKLGYGPTTRATMLSGPRHEVWVILLRHT